MKIFDAVTGESVALLDQKVSTSVLTGLALHPAYPDTRVVATTEAGEVLSLSLNGEEDAVCSKLDRGVKFFNGSHGLSTDGMKLYQMAFGEDGKRCRAFPVIKGSKPITAYASSTEFLAYACGKKVFLWSCLTDANRKSVESFEFERAVCSLSWCNSTLIVGLASGAVLAVKDVRTETFASIAQYSRQKLHWHANPVAAMAASGSDGYCVTGGEEAVAVLWNLGTGKNQFLPRLGAAITGVSVNSDGSKWVIATQDNAIFVIASGSFSVSCTIRGLAYAASGSSLAFMLKSPLDKAHLVVPGRTGALQVFDPVADRHIGLLPVTQENLVTGLPENRDSIKHSQVKLVAFHGKALMATYEHREASSCIFESDALRLWSYEAVAGSWAQIAIFDSPHGAGKLVASMAFNPATGALVTTDSCGSLRVWAPAEGSWFNGHCQPFHEGRPLTSLGFSPDGSVMLAVCGASILLFNALTYTYLQSLTYSITGTLLGAQFLDASGFVVAHDAAQVTVWNLETLQIEWSLNMAVAALAVHGAKFAVAAPSHTNPADSYTLLFNAASAVPTQARKHAGIAIAALAFVHAMRNAAKSKSKSIVMALAANAGRTFFQAFPEGEPVDGPTAISLSAASSGVATPLSKLVVESADKASAAILFDAVKPQWKQDAKPKDLLLSEVPSHVLPPMRLLFAAFAKLKLPAK